MTGPEDAVAPHSAGEDPRDSSEREPDEPQAGVPESTVTDVTPALGTSEEMRPAEGVHTPDVGPGGQQINTDDPASRGRAAGTS